MTDPARFAAAAAALAGSPFRLHGRDPATGLDCVGLVAEALERCGRFPQVPQGYSLRSLSIARLLRFAPANGFAPLGPSEPSGPGDLILLRPSAIQAHLAVALASGAFVHAHAGLGRVVIEPGAFPWPVAARWRLVPKG